MSIRFTDIGFVTSDVLRLRAFYEAVFGGTAEGNEVHSSLVAGGVTFAFDFVEPLRENPAFRYVSGGGKNSVFIGFEVDDADAEYKRLLPLEIEILNPPTTHPWGARSFQFKDPDGNILNFHGFPK